MIVLDDDVAVMKFVVVVGCIAVGANDIERSFQTGQIRPPITAFGHFSPAMKLKPAHHVSFCPTPV